MAIDAEKNIFSAELSLVPFFNLALQQNALPVVYELKLINNTGVEFFLDETAELFVLQRLIGIYQQIVVIHAVFVDLPPVKIIADKSCRIFDQEHFAITVNSHAVFFGNSKEVISSYIQIHHSFVLR